MKRDIIGAARRQIAAEVLGLSVRQLRRVEDATCENETAEAVLIEIADRIEDIKIDLQNRLVQAVKEVVHL